MNGKLASSILLVLLLSSFTAVLSVHALPSNSMWTQPATLNFSTNTTAVGHRFNVTVWLNMSTLTNSWQFYLVYQKAHLKAWRCDYTGNGKSLWAAALPTSSVIPTFGAHNATHDYVLHGEVLKSSAEKTGSGTLAWIEFEIIQAPAEGQVLTSELRLDKVGVFESGVMDKDFNTISLTFGKSMYKFSSPWTPPPTATIYVDPPKVADPLLTPCHNFTIEVKISKATSVYSFSFKLGFDKSTIHAVQAQLGTFFPPSAIPNIVIDNSAGYVLVSAHLSSPPTVSGNGTLAVIKFHVEALGRSDLHLYDAEIKDDVGRTLPSNTVDGYFNNVLLAKLYVDPPEIIDPTLIPPKTFEVNVTLDDVENLYGYQFNMSFNKNVLTCLYVIVNDVQGETHYIPETQVSNSKGFLWVKVDYYPPAVPITTFNPVALATIRFRVRSLGASVLDLHDTSLTNTTGGPIPHEVTDGFVMTVIHDVAITGATPSTSWAYAGWPVNITVTAKNLGNVSETFDVTAYGNTTLIGTIPVTNLAPNTVTTLTFTWDTTGLTAGIYTISANASIVPYELNTANNKHTDGAVNILTVKRDVAITNVVPEVNWAYQSWLVKITVTAANLGDIAETFNVTAYYDSTPIDTILVTNLAPTSSTDLTFFWNTTNIQPCHNYTISAEASQVPYEYNPSNNIYVDGGVKIRIVGDLNGDGKVDIIDVALASAAFGSYPGHPRWNPAADINRDLRIDVRDIARVSANFGRFC